jgi:hypothetical protein
MLIYFSRARLHSQSNMISSGRTDQMDLGATQPSNRLEDINSRLSYQTRWRKMAANFSFPLHESGTDMDAPSLYRIIASLSMSRTISYVSSWRDPDFICDSNRRRRFIAHRPIRCPYTGAGLSYFRRSRCVCPTKTDWPICESEFGVPKGFIS